MEHHTAYNADGILNGNEAQVASNTKGRARAIYLIIMLMSVMGYSFSAGSAPVVHAATTSEAAPTSASDCSAGTGWAWTGGPSEPELAHQAEAALAAQGIAGSVTVYDYGEKDTCGNFELFSTDFEVNLAATSSMTAQQDLMPDIVAAVSPIAKPELGKLRVNYADGRKVNYVPPTDTDRALAPAAPLSSAGVSINKKVYLLIYDPTLSNGQKLYQRMGWASPLMLTQNVISSFYAASHNQLNYTLAYTNDLNEWPLLADGYRYTESPFLSDYSNRTPHQPEAADYDHIIGDARFDICGKLNRGEIDELWIYSMPYSGLAESKLVGPNGYWYNSSPMTLSHGCTKLLPIMGLNYERGVAEAMHSFGHRAESSMARVYGTWQQNATDNNWERFALVKSLSPNYGYSGCGDIHFPANGVQDYDYADTASAPTNCDDFANYPSLRSATTALTTVTCSKWDCDHYQFLMYWFGHLPSSTGCTADNVNNDWWLYFADPNNALHPALGCSSAVFTSIAAQDGWILESREPSSRGGSVNVSKTTFRLGDDARDRQYRAVLSFETGDLPDDAIVDSALLTLTRQSVRPCSTNPFKLFRGLMIDVQNGYVGSSAAPEAADFQAAASLPALSPLQPDRVGTHYSFSISPEALSYINTSSSYDGATQLRLRLLRGDNDNAIANYVSFYAGEMQAYAPTLTITYHVP